MPVRTALCHHDHIATSVAAISLIVRYPKAILLPSKGASIDLVANAWCHGHHRAFTPKTETLGGERGLEHTVHCLVETPLIVDDEAGALARNLHDGAFPTPPAADEGRGRQRA